MVMPAVTPHIRIQTADFDVGEEIAGLSSGRKDIGAVVTFTGLCRDEAGKLSALELEHYPGMAEAEMQRIAGEACARWPLQGVTVIHRYGRMEPGDNIVLVATASTHRQAAFEAAAFIMDFLKSRAPFWKKEHRADGSQGDWVEARKTDEAALSAWNK